MDTYIYIYPYMFFINFTERCRYLKGYHKDPYRGNWKRTLILLGPDNVHRIEGIAEWFGCSFRVHRCLRNCLLLIGLLILSSFLFQLGDRGQLLRIPGSCIGLPQGKTNSNTRSLYESDNKQYIYIYICIHNVYIY